MKRLPRSLDRLALAALLWFVAGCCTTDASSDPPVGAPPPAGDAFLPPSAFEGNTKGVEAPAERGYQAFYDGFLTFSNVASADLEPLLPDGFVLASRVDGGDTHPIIFMSGDQIDGAYFSPLATYPSFVDYHETMLLIPFVQREGEDDWFTYVVRMYLDNLVAVAFGNGNYGYAKQWAKLEYSTATHTHRVSRFGKPKLSGVFRAYGTPFGIDEARLLLPNLDAMLEIMSTSMLGIYPEKDGSEFCSHFQWHFLSDSTVAAANTRVTVTGALRDDMATWVDRSFDNVEEGAVAFTGMVWRLANPPSVCPWWEVDDPTDLGS